MITKLSLRNFKSVGEQEYEFTQFDLLVGRNNSGKSTVLQALAIWQFCVDEFHRSKRGGSKGIQVVLPNFTALPVPEFNLLWKDRTDRHWPMNNGRKKQEYILIGIDVEWQTAVGAKSTFGIEIRYHSPQSIYAKPAGGWANFRTLEQNGSLPKIAYVPPFSGLEPTEQWLDVSPIRQQIGKGQPGSVLRNLLLRVCPQQLRGADGRLQRRAELPQDWQELVETLAHWFSVEIIEPKYESDRDVYIKVDYKQDDKQYDIIAGGSGFHQTLTLLAFLYGYKPTTILLDEPDAHLHVNLQREILNYFSMKSKERGIQFLIATHAEELVKGVDVTQIVSLLRHEPKRVPSSAQVLRAMADVSNEEVACITVAPYILYVEGEDDERILRAWATECGALDAMDRVYFKMMNGGTKVLMKQSADEHFEALKQISPTVTRLMLFDFDESATAFHPDRSNPSLFEWKRRNIENYLLVPDCWRRAALREMNVGEESLFAFPVLEIIDKFFSDQNLTLPRGKTWSDVTANIFNVVDGKRILFTDDDSLFQLLRRHEPSVPIIRHSVAIAMTREEIHEDVHAFFEKLKAMTGTV